MLSARPLMGAVVLAALLASTTACAGSGDEPETRPSQSASPVTIVTPSPGTSGHTETAWQDRYSDAQLDAYENAMSRYEEYETRSEPIWAAGKATDRAEAIFKQYFPSPLWQERLRLLVSYEAGNVRVEGTPGVYWSEAKSISDSEKSVVIEQCVDYTQGRTTQGGEVVEAPAWVAQPNLRTVKLEMPQSKWLIYGVVDASSGKPRPCTP